MLMVTTNALSCYSPCRILRRERKVTRPPRARTKIIQKSVSDTGTGVPLGLSPCRIPWLDREVTVPPIARMELMSDQMLMSEVVVVSLSSDYSDTLNALTHSQMCMVCTECLGIEGGHCRKTLLCSLHLWIMMRCVILKKLHQYYWSKSRHPGKSLAYSLHINHLSQPGTACVSA